MSLNDFNDMVNSNNTIPNRKMRYLEIKNYIILKRLK